MQIPIADILWLKFLLPHSIQIFTRKNVVNEFTRSDAKIYILEQEI